MTSGYVGIGYLIIRIEVPGTILTETCRARSLYMIVSTARISITPSCAVTIIRFTCVASKSNFKEIVN